MIDLSLFKSTLSNKPLAIAGLGGSGLAVIKACVQSNIPVIAWDDNEDQRNKAKELGADIQKLSTDILKTCGALCATPGMPLTHPEPHQIIKNANDAGIDIIGDIEIFHRAKPNAKTIAVTGTNGKSTTTALIGHILKSHHQPSAMGGNIGDAILSLPDLPNDGIYAIEMSSYQIDLCPTFHPNASVLMNISPDHLDRHGGIDGYIAVKEKIFNGSGTGVIGIDDDYTSKIYDRQKNNKTRKIIPVSCKRPLKNGVFVSKDGILFDHDDKILDLNICPALKGQHNWQNAAIAYVACSSMGVDKKVIIHALQSFPGLEHRQFKIGAFHHVTYINDSKATNDDAASRALSTYQDIYWIAGGASKGGGYAMCEKHLNRVRHAFLIGEAMGEMATWLDKNNKPYTMAEDLMSATIKAHHMAQKEKNYKAVVLLSPACASFDQFSSYVERGNAFIDVVHKLIHTDKDIL